MKHWVVIAALLTVFSAATVGGAAEAGFIVSE
jgi:hypothetical protein